LSLPYGLDNFILQRDPADPSIIIDVFITDSEMHPRIAAFETAPTVVTALGDENIERYIRSRMWSAWQSEAPLPADPKIGRPVIWKLHRRVHWAVISLMVGFFRKMELEIERGVAGAGSYHEAGWSPAAWFPSGMVAPRLAVKTPVDAEWKDFISYYAVIYAAYNTSASNWRRILKDAEVKRLAVGSTLSLRDYLLFRYNRRDMVIDHIIRFAVGLDSYMRLDFLEGVAPADFAGREPNKLPPSGRVWGV
jgi:hypothetical protein